MIIVGKKWDKNAQYVGRGTPLGNPFPMRDKSLQERNRVCDQYALWFKEQIANSNPAVAKQLQELREELSNTGKLTLGCYCAPLRCHAETIKDFLINGDTP